MDRRKMMALGILGGRTSYILNDSFLGTVAGGGVNGTLATTGQIRTVTDTGNKMSIGGGKLNFAVGGVGNGNPGIWYPLITRAFGRTLLGYITPTLGGGDHNFGWDGNQGTTISDGIRFGVSSNQIRATDNATTINVMGFFYGGITYSLACVLKDTAGQFYFIKGGAYTNWTLLWISSNFTSSGAYPAVTFISNALESFYAESLRVPRALIMIIPLSYDTFVRGDGVLGNTERSGPDNQVTPILPWSVKDGTIEIVGNKASSTVLGVSGLSIATLNTPSADVVLDVPVTRTAGSAGVILRYESPTDYLIAYVDGTNCKLDKVVAGVTTNVITGVVTYVAEKVLRVILRGTSAALHYGAANVGSFGTVPTSSYTEHGLYSNDLSASWSKITIWASGMGNEYSILDNY
jgi:hypothetical protein